MNDFSIVLMASVGMTLIFCHGSIFRSLQNRFELFRCPMCAGWWVGLMGAMNLAADSEDGSVLRVAAMPFCCSLFSYAAAAMILAADRYSREPIPPTLQDWRPSDGEPAQKSE